jgi:hypothetical protein
MRIETLSDSPTLARHVAKWMTSLAEVATGIFHVALSGGSTPRALLAADSFPRRLPLIVRCLILGRPGVRSPDDHPESN